jgi:hypothetical protein
MLPWKVSKGQHAMTISMKAKHEIEAFSMASMNSFKSAYLRTRWHVMLLDFME